MKLLKFITPVLTVGSLLLFTGCSTKKIPSSKGGYTYKGIYFGSYFTKHFKEGINEGCETARGDYTKNHWLFKHSKDYKNGWFLGRNRCKKLLKIDKNGDLVL